MGALGGVDNAFAYRMLIFAMAVMLLFPTFLTVFVVDYSDDEDEVYDELLDGYYEFTGTNAATSEEVWVLTGIYTPYSSGGYGYTDDGWLYGTKVQSYSPTQYAGTIEESTVALDDDGVYRYTSSTAYGDHEEGDLYTSVVMDVSQKSDIFFTTSTKTESDDGSWFYYEYSGYRYSFQPRANYTATDADGNEKTVVATSTSLSLIWYDYYGSSGISGQLIISGSDSGVAYLTAAEIIRAFDSSTSTTSFSMTFNGVDMNIYIRVDPYMIAQGYTIEECYNLGYWSIMVSSLSTDASSYTGTDYSFNVYAIWDTLISLFTFDTASLGLDGLTGTIASLVVCIPLYAALLSIGMSFYPVLILAGILAAIQSLVSIF